jgi:hypothetical protein
LGKVEDEDRLGVAEFLADVALQFVEDRLVVPAARTHEELEGPTFQAGLRGDGFNGLAWEAGELAGQDGEGVPALFRAVEAGEVALGEGGEAAFAGADVVSREFGIVQQGLGVGMVENVQGGLQKRYRRSA